MELLAQFGTSDQKRRYLEPLLDGRTRSAFSMTEPLVASSDATNIATRIVRDGSEYVINGRKWFTSGAMSPRCDAADRDGGQRSRRRTTPAPEHDPRGPADPWRRRPPLAARARLPRRATRRTCRSRLRRRSGACRQPARSGGRGLRDRPGASGARPDPSCDAGHWRRRAGAVDDGAADRRPGCFRQAADRPGGDSSLDCRRADGDRAGPFARAEDGLADGHCRQQGAPGSRSQRSRS